MNEWYLGLACFLLLNMAAGFVRILRGPTEADRMLAAQLFGTTGVGILLLLAPALGPALNDIALVFALLAAVATIAFVTRTHSRGAEEEEDSSHVD
jgi:multicomponent Na+:H+ antiporter subunit F